MTAPFEVWIRSLGHRFFYYPERHPCGHQCYPGRKPDDWCIECKYGNKPYH